MDETEAAYYAGLIDGEGYVGIRTVSHTRNKKGNPNKSYALQIVTTNIYPDIFIRAKKRWGGSISTYLPHNRTKRIYKWNLSSQDAYQFLQDIFPYSQIKHKQIEIALVFQNRINTSKRQNGKLSDMERFVRKTMQQSIRKLNARDFNGSYILEEV